MQEIRTPPGWKMLTSQWTEVQTARTQTDCVSREHRGSRSWSPFSSHADGGLSLASRPRYPTLLVLFRLCSLLMKDIDQVNMIRPEDNISSVLLVTQMSFIPAPAWSCSSAVKQFHGSQSAATPQSCNLGEHVAETQLLLTPTVISFWLRYSMLLGLMLSVASHVL